MWRGREAVCLHGVSDRVWSVVTRGCGLYWRSSPHLMPAAREDHREPRLRRWVAAERVLWSVWCVVGMSQYWGSPYSIDRRSSVRGTDSIDGVHGECGTQSV